jgi:hypothetical protein
MGVPPSPLPMELPWPRTGLCTSPTPWMSHRSLRPNLGPPGTFEAALSSHWTLCEVRRLHHPPPIYTQIAGAKGGGVRERKGKHARALIHERSMARCRNSTQILPGNVLSSWTVWIYTKDWPLGPLTHCAYCTPPR